MYDTCMTESHSVKTPNWTVVNLLRYYDSCGMVQYKANVCLTD